MKPILFLFMAMTIAGCKYRPHRQALMKEYSRQIQDYPPVPDSVARNFLSSSEKELWKSDSGDTPSSLNRDDFMKRRVGLFATDSMLGISEKALLELFGQPTETDSIEFYFEKFYTYRHRGSNDTIGEILFTHDTFFDKVVNVSVVAHCPLMKEPTCEPEVLAAIDSIIYTYRDKSIRYRRNDNWRVYIPDTLMSIADTRENFDISYGCLTELFGPPEKVSKLCSAISLFKDYTFSGPSYAVYYRDLHGYEIRYYLTPQLSLEFIYKSRLPIGCG